MNENDYRSLIMVYQQKVNDLFSQLVSCEAKLLIANQTIESLMKKIEDEKVIASQNKKTVQKNIVANSEEF